MTSITPQWPPASRWARRAHHDSCDARVLHAWVSFYPELTPKGTAETAEGLQGSFNWRRFFDEHGGQRPHIWLILYRTCPGGMRQEEVYQNI